MRRAGRTSLVLALCGALSVAAPAQAKFLEDLDKAMKDYATNLQTTGDHAMDFITGKKYGLTAIDAAMKAYSGDLQKTGDDALADLKPIIKDLMDPLTYLPGPLRKAWEALVGELAVLRDRFLRRCDNPWADDPPAGGGGGAEPPPAEPPPADPPPPAPDPSPAPSAAPAAGGGDTPPPSPEASEAPVKAPAAGSADTPAATDDAPVPAAGAALDGQLPGDTSVESSIRAKASGVRKRHTMDDAAIREQFDTFVQFRQAAQRAYQMQTGLVDTTARSKVSSKVNWMIDQVRVMEARLLARLERNRHALGVFCEHVSKMDKAVARGSFGPLVGQLNRRMSSIQIDGDPTAAASVGQLRALANQLRNQIR